MTEVAHQVELFVEHKVSRESGDDKLTSSEKY